MLDLLRRVLSDCSMDAKSEAYTTLERPQVEYACSEWNPYTKRNIHQIELVQHRAERFVFRDYSNFTHVTPMLKQLGWDTLEQRRLSHQLEQFSFECRKTKIKVITLANHKEHRQYSEPIKT